METRAQEVALLQRLVHAVTACTGDAATTSQLLTLERRRVGVARDVQLWVVVHVRRVRSATLSSAVRSLLSTVRDICEWSLWLAQSSSRRAMADVWYKALGLGDLWRGTSGSLWAMEQDEGFPRVHLNFAGAKVTRDLLDDCFSASSVDANEGRNTFGPLSSSLRRVLAIGVGFARSRLKHDVLLHVQQLIQQHHDRVNQATYRQSLCAYDVQRLDISGNVLTEDHLGTLAVMARTTGIVEWDLTDTLSAQSSPSRARAFARFVSAAFQIGESCPRRPLTLRVGGNQLSSYHVAALGSAMAHSHVSFVELSLENALPQLDVTDRSVSLAWLGYGVGRKSQQQRVVLDLSKNSLHSGDIDSFRRGWLLDPSALGGQLCGLGGDHSLVAVKLHAGSPVLMWPDASAEVLFQAGPDEIFGGFRALGDWLGIVVPGFGCAWVANSSVVHGEQIPSDILAACELSLDALVWNEAGRAQQSFGVFIDEWLDVIGASLVTLELRSSPCRHQDELSSIVSRCTNIQHLIVDNCQFPSLEAVVHALDACHRLRSQLLTLEATGNRIGMNGAIQLAGVLMRHNDVVLRNLRLGKNMIGAGGVRSLLQALSLNKSLHVIELDAPHTDAEYENALNQLVASFQSEPIEVVALSVHHRLALVSCVQSMSLASDVDVEVLQMIFAFAGTITCRQIIVA